MANYTVLHLSDVHLAPDRPEQDVLLLSFAEALRRERDEGRMRADLVAITGDVFDSGTLPQGEALSAFRHFLDLLRRGLSDEVPVLVLPGNHDRRGSGVIGPHRVELFDALRDEMRRVDPHVWVAGCNTPFLTEHPPAVFGAALLRAPFFPVAYDSTYLASGWISAGGVMRPEELLQVADEVARSERDVPVVFFTHHHLIPTPLTDVSKIDVSRHPAVVRFMVKRVLPRLVSNADSEELTMTALGAGTALSALHAFGRAVLVVHGHKHYPTARLLKDPGLGSGDVLLSSAGSVGVSESWEEDSHPDQARLWPSFNVLRFDGDKLDIEMVAFAPDAPSHPARHRTLCHATREGRAWVLSPIADEPAPELPPLSENEAIYTLSESKRSSGARWNCEVRRTVTPGPGWDQAEYVEVAEGLPGSMVERVGQTGDGTGDGEGPQQTPRSLALSLTGSTTYRLTDGICRTTAEGAAAYGPGTAFEWVGLLNRYHSKKTRLVLRGLPEWQSAFASTIDLTTGRERPLVATREDGEVSIECPDCPGRTHLRINWPLLPG